MTYCLSLLCREGIVFLSDSRTSAGVDNITIQPKMRIFVEGKRGVVCLMTSGNLSLSQTVISLIEEDAIIAATDPDHPHLMGQPTMFETARYVGQKIRQVSAMDRQALEADGISFNVNFLVGGQILGGEPEIHLVYPQGNTIEATRTSPFLQIGEYKYGKPILDRGFTFETSLADAVKLALISMEGTMKSNVSVGPPLDLFAYERDTFSVRFRSRLDEGDPRLNEIRKKWSAGLAQLVRQMPGLDFEEPVPHIVEMGQ